MKYLRGVVLVAVWSVVLGGMAHGGATAQVDETDSDSRESLAVGIAGDADGQISAFLDDRGVANEPYQWGEDLSPFSAIVVNAPADPGEKVFAEFIAGTDETGVGVVLLDTFSPGNRTMGVELAHLYSDNPAERERRQGGGRVDALAYEVAAAHPVVGDAQPGEVIDHDVSSQHSSHAWFDGYTGDGATVVANVLVDGYERGHGIAVDDRDDNRHVLLSLHGASSFVGPGDWTDSSAQVLVDAVDYAAAAGLVGVQVEPESAKLTVDEIQQFTATAIYDDGSEVDVTEEAAWTSADPDVVTVDGAGLATAVAEGEAGVTATFEDVVGEADVVVDESDPDGVVWTDFRDDEYEVGEAPDGWTSLWGGDSDAFTVQDFPRRVHHNNKTGREVLTFDAAETVDLDRDAEVSAVVRVPADSSPSTTGRLQVHLQASGASGSENSFYADATGSAVRLGEYFDGNHSHGGDDYSHSYAVQNDVWHEVIVQRVDDTWRTKVWPYGDEEPDEWMVEAHVNERPNELPAGMPGFGNGGGGALLDVAWFSAAVDTDAFRAPDDLFEPADDAVVTGIVIDPDSATIGPAGSISLTATAQYSDGSSTEETTGATWTSSDSSIAQVDDGVVTATGDGGDVTISAALEGVSGTAVITVDPEYVPTTPFEESDGENWTSIEEELQFLHAVEAHSDRMRFEAVGESVQGRPLHKVVVGGPTAPADDEIADGHSTLVVAAQHGNEPAGREAALQHIRDMAFTEDPDEVARLEQVTMLYIPTANPDGIATNSYHNAQGRDVNRGHHNLNIPEAAAIAEVMQEMDPEAGLDLHERPSDDPEMEVLWPRNLNMDEELRDLNEAMVDDHLFPALEDAGYTYGVHGSPGGVGGGDERIIRNVFGLRHMLGLLTESGRAGEPVDRVGVQRLVIDQVYEFTVNQRDVIGDEVAASKSRRQADGADGGEYFFEGRNDADPPGGASVSSPCGYLLDDDQVDKVTRHFDSFGVESEQHAEGLLVPMEQPMMTILPLVVDPRAQFNVVNGLVVDDCDDLPSEPQPAQFTTDFTEDEHRTGELPFEWREFNDPDTWVIQDEPRRLEGRIADGGRQGVMWEEPANAGIIEGDAEAAGLVRNDRGPGANALFQIALQASGNGANYYYADAILSTGTIRINKVADGEFSTVGSAPTDMEFEDGAWYQVVFHRTGDELSAKVWPYGEDEPDDWQVTVEDTTHSSGYAGITHVTDGTTTEWAWFSVGTGGQDAARAPADHFD